MTLYRIEPKSVYQTMRSYTASSFVGTSRGQNAETDVYLTPQPSSTFDIWRMENEQMGVDSSEVFLPDMMQVNWREAKNVIPKENKNIYCMFLSMYLDLMLIRKSISSRRWMPLRKRWRWVMAAKTVLSRSCLGGI